MRQLLIRLSGREAEVAPSMGNMRGDRALGRGDVQEANQHTTDEEIK